LFFPIIDAPYIPTSLVIIGSFAAMTPPPIYAYPKEIMDEESVIGFGIISTCTATSVLLVPIIGYLKDFTGIYYASFGAMALSAFIAILFIVFLDVKKT
jgi:fucose permease